MLLSNFENDVQAALKRHKHRKKKDENVNSDQDDMFEATVSKTINMTRYSTNSARQQQWRGHMRVWIVVA